MYSELLIKFKENIKTITKYYQKLIRKTKQKENIGSINEWIIDNYYIISEQEKNIRADFLSDKMTVIRKKRKKQLHELMQKILSEKDYNLDINEVFIFLNDYQKENKDYFSYDEIVYIYLLIKIVLIEKLTELVNTLEHKIDIKDEVNRRFKIIFKRIANYGDFKLSSNFKFKKNLLKEAYYIEQINYKLKELGEASDEAFKELNELLIENNLSLKEIIQTSQTEMAKDNFYMINIFGSLKKAARYKLEYLFKNLSFAEKVLINEDVQIYDQMYDSSKNVFRDRVAKLAKKSKISEYEYAYGLVTKSNEEKRHVAWNLFRKKHYNFRIKVYLLVALIGTIGLSYLFANLIGMGSFLFLLIPMSTFVIEVMNQILMIFTKATSLFKLKFEEGLPEEYSTMVVIPTIVKDAKKVNQMLDNLEVYYLSNKTENIYFTLLGDCSSEKVKETPKDDEIAKAGIAKVKELNAKYGKELFYFVYRNRFYNDGEGSYLGFERKRGALNHFNKLLLGKLSKKEQKDYFRTHTFNDFQTKIKYVITLDTDTKLVLNTALKLIGTMAHPLNRAVLSPDKKKVISGYGIMQPRISIDVEVTSKSLYSQLFAGLGGLDIYTTACFDLYQDIFNQGSFVGKGIYDLEVFETVMDNTFPNNLILSHDLLEGNYLRCGFINDVELFDDYPASYLNDAVRHHRWNRGDWQIISWLKRKVKNAKDEISNNPIGLLEKWKIFDNLRRSQTSLFLLLIIFYGFTFGNVHPTFFLLITLTIIATPIFFYLLSNVIYRSKYDRFLKYYLDLVRGTVAVVNKSFVIFAVLPYEAKLYLDSTIRALYRMFISHKKLLNWITAEEVEKTLKNNLKTYLNNFRVNYLASIILILFSYFFKKEALHVACLLAFIWSLAPVILYLISRSISKEKDSLTEEEKEEIKDIAYQTWQYFDSLLTEENNYLIPDNYQFNREEKADYKTSPTNIGFSLVSVISAVSLEFITANKGLELINNIISSVEKLNKWHGHLYNWYNIHTLKEIVPYVISTVDNGNLLACLYVTKGFLEKYGDANTIKRVINLIEEADFKKLYNKDLDVFSIAYDYPEQNLSAYHYNNFASESRLTSFLAIAKGDAPYKHWFCLDKTLTKYKGYKGMVSWSGTAFEYFMPLIFMKTYQHTLLDESYYFAYHTQKGFAKEIDGDLPWGISESAYNELDDAQNYKYRAFGVPYLKLQDIITYPIVISPYSSLMAISVDDVNVYENINKMKKLGLYSDFGFYEAYDYDDNTITKNYYAHHQGMILSSLANYLNDNIIQEYFHEDKSVQAIEMLLKEKVQIRTYIDLKIARYKHYQYNKEVQTTDFREYNELKEVPEMGVLSNGFYSMLINDRGVGISKYKNLQINRFREITSEEYGLFLYIKNLNNGKIWSNTYAPLNHKIEHYKVIFASDRIKYVREDEGIVTTTELTVVKDHNAEIRKVTFKNNTNEDVTLELTSYGEVIMCRIEEEVAHPAFNGLTITSEANMEKQAINFVRKSRTKENTTYFVTHRMFLDHDDKQEFSFETSRANFIGRNNMAEHPKAIFGGDNLTNFAGAPLDPIMSIRKTITIKAKSKASAYMLVGFGKSREQIEEIIDTYKDEFSVNKAFDMTTVLNNMRNSYANLTNHQMKLYNTMLMYVYQGLPITNKRNELLKNNDLCQADLWKFGISGNLPIITVEIAKIEDANFVKEVLQAFEFYKSRAINIDILIINNEEPEKENLIGNYINNLMYRINNLNYFENSPGNVYVISGTMITEEEKRLLNLVARLSLDASNFKSLEDQIRAFAIKTKPLDNTYHKQISLVYDEEKLPDIVNNNDFGGFVDEGSAYLITTNNTPTPWSNVLANEKFGSIITNNFGGYTYAYNSREFKLTAWSNDFVSDRSSEIITINGLRIKANVVKHGFGYSDFICNTKDYEITIKVFVANEDPIKFYRMSIKNKHHEVQKLELGLILRMVLGTSEEQTSRFILSEFDNDKNALIMTNKYQINYKNINVFVSATENIDEYDDKDIETKLINLNLELKANETKDLAFTIGVLENENILTKYHKIDVIDEEAKIVSNNWKQKLNTIKVNTPDQEFNYMINGWYLYQVYASRLYARAGFYQAGGAFGFRDQLQDIMSVIYADKDYARKQIIKHAMHQFKEGDVLHWWHEDLRFGAKTRFSDDYLWLIYVTSEYLKITSDYSILDEKAPFVIGPNLAFNENEKGIIYDYSEEAVSLYEHLKCSIYKATSQYGSHGLPLMGCGDWNDGMSKIGHEGKGESVFVAFFLIDNLTKMLDIASRYNDQDMINLCNDNILKLKEAVKQNTWDGSWYLRAYYDNGEKLGSKENSECQIDLLCQSWSVLTNVAGPSERNSIFKEVENRLVDPKNKLVKLITPAFKNTKNNPGYIKDYVPGIRENGGQYTHAVFWYVMALINDGQVDFAYEVYQMINPINHAKKFKDAYKYQVEPYVIPADVYTNDSWLGKGGWTWYTGSASWAYKVAIENILGLQLNGDKLTIKPNIPSNWDRYEIIYKYLNTEYHIEVLNPKHTNGQNVLISMDEKNIKNNIITLVDDKNKHQIKVTIKEDL